MKQKFLPSLPLSVSAREGNTSQLDNALWSPLGPHIQSPSQPCRECTKGFAGGIWGLEQVTVTAQPRAWAQSFNGPTGGQRLGESHFLTQWPGCCLFSCGMKNEVRCVSPAQLDNTVESEGGRQGQRESPRVWDCLATSAPAWPYRMTTVLKTGSPWAHTPSHGVGVAVWVSPHNADK